MGEGEEKISRSRNKILYIFLLGRGDLSAEVAEASGDSRFGKHRRLDVAGIVARN